KGARRGLDIGLTHQAFADEEGAHAGTREAGEIIRREDTAFADNELSLRHERGEALGRGERCLEGLEVSIVDAEKRTPERERAGEFGLVMHLDEHVHAPMEG